MYKLFITLLILFPFSLISCNAGNEASINPQSEAEFTDIVTLKKGAVKTNDKGKYKNLDYIKGEYKECDSVDVAASFDYESGSYVGQSDGKYVVNFHNNRFVLENIIETGDYGFSVSPGGGNFLFFRNTNEGKRLNVYSLRNKESIQVKNKAVISGEYVRWYDDNSIIFYGVNQEENLNGIFLYNLEDSDEKCLIPIEDGIVEFLSKLENEIVYCISTSEGKKLISYNISTKQNNILSTKVFNIYDIVKIDQSYYFLGQLVTADDSLYKISDGNINRLVYDFPMKVIVKKEMMLTDNNEILFIGKDNDTYENKIYKSTKDGNISLVKEFNQEIAFVK